MDTAAMRGGRRLAPTRSAALVAVLVAALLLVAVAGCTRSPEPASGGPRPPSPFAACPEPAELPAVPSPAALPAVTLECFAGGQPVDLSRLGQPAVINLWASWCPPCVKELPELQAFADEFGDRVLVLGVVTDDRWNWAVSAGEELGVRFPAVFDPDRTLLKALGRAALPVTLFVASDGSVRHTDVTGKLTRDRLRELAAQHLELRP